MAQIINITSEALQATIRRLLPSQQGFGEDLQATNVITPVIDITPASDDSSFPESLTSALAFGSQTSWTRAMGSAGTTVIANSPGFWRVKAFLYGNFTATGSCVLDLYDGSTSKHIAGFNYTSFAGQPQVFEDIDIIVFLGTGESVRCVNSNNQRGGIGTVRQIADVNGVIVNPSGFNPQ